MTAIGAFREGVRRVNRAPIVLLGAVSLTFLMALPLSLVVNEMIADHLGESAAAEAVAGGADYAWWAEFASQASGLGTTFTPSVTGFAAVLHNLEGLLDNRPLAATVTGITIAWLIFWSFLAGGVMDRYARGRPTYSHGFFAACGAHFWRFLRLGAVAWCAYVALFGAVHYWVFDAAYGRLIRDLTVERAAFAWRISGYVAFAAIMAAVALCLDFARVRIVVEDRRSAIGALIAGGRFIGRHRRRVFGLLLLNGAALAALMAAYGLLAPGAPRSGAHLWMALTLGQAYIIGRHYVKLLVYASEIALFQDALAHRAYSAFPTVVWPDSPAVETITNAESMDGR